MAEKTEKKKWVTPKLVGLGKMSAIEDNDQISLEKKHCLIDLRDSLLAENPKVKTSQSH